MAIKKKIKRKPAMASANTAVSNEPLVGAKSAASPFNMTAKTGVMGGPVPSAKTGQLGPDLEGANIDQYQSGIADGIKSAVASNPSLQNLNEQNMMAEKAVENLPKGAIKPKAKAKVMAKKQPNKVQPHPTIDAFLEDGTPVPSMRTMAERRKRKVKMQGKKY